MGFPKLIDQWIVLYFYWSIGQQYIYTFLYINRRRNFWLRHIFQVDVHSSPLYMSARLQNYGLGESFNAFNRSNDSDENNKNIENIHISLLLFTNTFHHLSSLINSRIERVAKINYSLLMKSKYLSEDRRQGSPGGSSIFPGLFIFVSLQIRVKKSMRNLVKLEKCRPKSYSFSLKAPLSWFMFTYSRLLCCSIHTHDGAERALPLMNGAELPLQRWERKQACCAVRFVRRLDAESFQRWKIILLLWTLTLLKQRREEKKYKTPTIADI